MSNNHNQPERSSGQNSENETNPRRSTSLAAGNNGKKDVHASFAPTPPPQGSSSSAGASGNSQLPSTEPSAIVLISPRVLQSQNYIDGTSSVHLSTIFYEVDDTQSTISLRISRGKSQVNVQDPSRSYHRIAGDTCSAVVMVLGGDVEPQNQIFPSPVLEKPFGNVKAEYDFYTPGQTMENVKDKVHQAKTRLSEMKDCLVKVRETACILSAIADSVRKPSDVADEIGYTNESEQPKNHRNSPTEDNVSMKTNTTGLSEDRTSSLSSNENTDEGGNLVPDSGQKFSDDEPASNPVPNEDSNDPNLQ